MVIGVYGLGYAYVAWKPEKGDVLVLLGLVGRVLGPIGWLWAVGQGEFPPRMFPLILANDLIWWFPFLAYLLRRSAKRRVIIAMTVVAFHILGCIALLIVRHGTDAESDVVVRAGFVLAHSTWWTICWFVWSAASMGLLAFFVVWAVQLRESQVSRTWLLIGCGLCAVGLCIDLLSEAIAIVCLQDSHGTLERFEYWARAMSLLGAGIGNGLYCVGGAVMSVASWRAGFQRGLLATVAAAMWMCGIGLSVATFADQLELMMFLGAVVMILFILWATFTGLRFHNQIRDAEPE
jgi:hypothetical protein